VVLGGEAPGREALDQALKLNPAFFQAVYLDLIDGPKTEPVIADALKQLDDYLVERADVSSRRCSSIWPKRTPRAPPPT
jgi:hypothetical protein